MPVTLAAPPPPNVAVPAADGLQHDGAAAAPPVEQSPAASALRALLSCDNLKPVFDLILGCDSSKLPAHSSGSAFQKDHESRSKSELEKLCAISPKFRVVFSGAGIAVEHVCNMLEIDAALVRAETSRFEGATIWDTVRRHASVVHLGDCSCEAHLGGGDGGGGGGGAAPAAVVPGSFEDNDRIRFLYLPTRRAVCKFCLGESANALISAKAAHEAGCSKAKVLSKVPAFGVERRDVLCFGFLPRKPCDAATVYLAADVLCMMRRQQRSIKGVIKESMVMRDQLAVDPSNPGGSSELLGSLSLGDTRRVELLTCEFDFTVVLRATAQKKRLKGKRGREVAARTAARAGAGAVRKKRGSIKKWSCSACGKTWARRFSRTDPPHKKGSKLCSKTGTA